MRGRLLRALLLLLALLPGFAAGLDLHAEPRAVPNLGNFKLENPMGNNEYRNTTIGIMAVTTVVLIAYDIFLARNHYPTESKITTDASWDYSSIPFAGGVLAGHLFFNTSNPKNRVVPLGLAILGGVITWDLTRSNRGTWVRYPGIWFAIGVGTGASMWGQRGRM